MTLSSTATKVTYNGDGATIVFPVTFVFWLNADLRVILRDALGAETVWVEGTQYTLTGGNGATGTLTVKTTPTDFTPLTGEKLTIKDVQPEIQGDSLPLSGAFPSTVVEQRFDKITRMVQQHSEELTRTLQVPETDPAPPLVSLPDDRASKILAFNSTKQPIAVDPTDASSTAVTATETSVARFLADRFIDVYKAEDEGASPLASGAVNVAAINTAIVAANAAGGGIVEIAEGIFEVDLVAGAIAITLKPNVWLRGQGMGATTIRLANAQDAHVIQFEAAGALMFVSDLAIDGNKINQTLAVHGIRLENNSRCGVFRVKSDANKQYGIGSGDVTNPTADCFFHDLVLTNNDADGFDMKRGSRCSFRNIRCEDNGDRGFDIRGEQHTYDSIYAYRNATTGINLRSLGVPASDDSYIVATNCYAFGNTSHGFFLANNETPIVGWTAKYKLSNCFSDGNTGRGFYVNGDTMDVEMRGCSAVNNSSHGFQWAVPAASSGIKIIGGQFTGNGIDGIRLEAGGGRAEIIGAESFDNTSHGLRAFSPVSVLGGRYENGDACIRLEVATADNSSVIGAEINVNTGINDGLRVDTNNCLVSACQFFRTVAGVNLRITATADATSVQECNFNGVTTGTKISDIGTNGVTRNNVGWVTENSGIATILFATTAITVTHGLAVTPTLDDIGVILGENPTNDPGNIWVDTITSTQFNINCRANPGASNLDVAWRAAVL